MEASSWRPEPPQQAAKGRPFLSRLARLSLPPPGALIERGTFRAVKDENGKGGEGADGEGGSILPRGKTAPYLGQTEDSYHCATF